MLSKYNLIRHAERERLSGNVAKALLTEKGKKDAEELGKKLSNEITEKTIITSSPFRRAYQTAFYFQKGAGKGKLIKVEEITDNVYNIKEGYFVKWWENNNKEFFDYISSKDINEIHKEWLEENKLKNTLSKETCTKRDLNKIKEIEKTYSFDKIIIFTHDTTIVYFWHYFHNKLMENPKVLEGIKSNNLEEWSYLKSNFL